MSTLSQGRVGPLTGADGTQSTVRLEKEIAQIIAQLRGKYAEACERQQVFAVHAEAGIYPGTSVGTTTALDISNPLTSGVRLEILKVGLGFLSGTGGYGWLGHGKLDTQGSTVPTGGTAITPTCCAVGKPASVAWTAGYGRAVAAAPTVLYPFLSWILEAAATASPMKFLVEDVDGAISVEPGGSYVLTGVATAGTTPLFAAGVVVRQRVVI